MMTAQQAQSHDVNPIRGLLVASGPVAAFWLALAVVALVLTGCGTASPEDRAREAWGNMPTEMRDDMCEALFLLGPVQTNEIIETLANDMPDEDVDALKRVMLEECAE